MPVQPVEHIVAVATRKLPLVVVLLLVAAGVFFAAKLFMRHVEETRGVGAVDAPVYAAVAAKGSSTREGRFKANIEYSSLAAPGDGRVVSPVTWDDAWFGKPADGYNHELAYASSVLAALAYSESSYYQAKSSQPAYMEHALAELGFDEVSTDSYRYRSEVVDEVLNLFTDDADAVAYTVARKHLRTEDGRPRDLIMVSVRGSYGSEWLSNLKMTPVEAVGDGAGDAAGSEPVANEAGGGDAAGRGGVDGAVPALDAPLVRAATGASIGRLSQLAVDAGERLAPLTDAAAERLAPLTDAADRARARAAEGHRRAMQLAQIPLERARESLNDAISPVADVLEDWLTFVSALAGADTAADAADRAAVRMALDGTSDHRGYFRAAEDICCELNRWVEESRAAGAEVEVLVVGHSRGGAIANLVASELDDLRVRAQEAGRDQMSSLDEVERVYAYTFAAPATTVRHDAHAGRYGNIFNIVNPSDIMPYLPLRAWGYERYGTNLYLPTVGDKGFEPRLEAMRADYAATVGAPSEYDPADKLAIDAVMRDVSARVAQASDLLSPAGVATVVGSCAAHVDPVRILYGHYPSTYVAWMNTVGPDGLTAE